MTPNPRIFASLDDFTPPGNGPQMVGRNMANYFFFQALMRYGTFDEYHFFLSNRAHRNLFKEKHSLILDDPNMASKIRLFDRVALPDAMRQFDYTVIHQSDHVTYLASLARLRNSLQVKIPLSAFIHSLSYPSYMTRYLEMHFSGLSASDSIICSSECGRTVVERCLNNTTVKGGAVSPVTLKVIPLGIDEPPRAMDRLLARKQLGWKNNQVVALCFGRFSDFDKMDLFPLLQAMKLIEGPQYRLVLAGAVHDEEYYKILQLWVKALGLTDRVDFLVAPNNQKKLALFAGADFFVSIADNPQETFGLTVLEAMHAGTPLVVSDFDGYRELAGDEAGIRVPTTWIDIPRLTEVESLMDMRTLHRYLAQTMSVDMGELTKALHTMFTNEALRQEYGSQARKRFEAHFVHANIISRLESHWLAQKERFEFNDAPLNLLDMRIHDTFSHYVTHTLTDAAVLKTTDFARQLLAANADYPLLSGMSEVVNHARVNEVAKYCYKTRTLADIAKKMGDHWKIRFTLMWMIKHDLLRIVSSPD